MRSGMPERTTMQYVIGLAVLAAVLATVLIHRRLRSGQPVRHRSDVDVPNLWTAWRQR